MRGEKVSGARSEARTGECCHLQGPAPTNNGETQQQETVCGQTDLDVLRSSHSQLASPNILGGPSSANNIIYNTRALMLG